VAASVVAVALLFVMALFAQEMRLERRARAQQQALLALESAIEGLRAGALPVTTPEQIYDEPAPFVVLPPGRGSVLDVVVRPDESIPYLWSVLVKVRFASGGELVERSMGTQIWMPPS
jgi:type II secretory pathway pseudopilin PulG